MMTPAIVIDGQVKASGKLVAVDVIKTWLLQFCKSRSLPFTLRPGPAVRQTIPLLPFTQTSAPSGSTASLD